MAFGKRSPCQKNWLTPSAFQIAPLSINCSPQWQFLQSPLAFFSKNNLARRAKILFPRIFFDQFQNSSVPMAWNLRFTGSFHFKTGLSSKRRPR
jgi:hypothetical protein